jgi:OmpA-OmpF porin, OOP family
MKHTIFCVAIAGLFLAGCTTIEDKHSNRSTPPTPKLAITDKQIHSDYANYEVQQARIKALNDSARHRVASYSLAKAQCWLDVSLHEYTRNDRSDFPALAFLESVKITDHLSQAAAVAGTDNPAHATPLLNSAAKLRPDLWEAAAKLKSHAGWRCAEQKTACAEVELVHAGNEWAQGQWRHAKPYIQLAEDYIDEAQRAAQTCQAPAATAVRP